MAEVTATVYRTSLKNCIFVSVMVEEAAAQSLVDGKINSKLPPEILSNIFQFLTFTDLKQALLVCR